MFFFLKTFIYLFTYLFLERGEGREKEWERNIIVWLPLTHPPLRVWPATQACVLIGNRTSNPLLHRLALSPLSHSSQGWENNVLKSKTVSRILKLCILLLDTAARPAPGLIFSSRSLVFQRRALRPLPHYFIRTCQAPARLRPPAPGLHVLAAPLGRSAVGRHLTLQLQLCALGKWK